MGEFKGDLIQNSRTTANHTSFIEHPFTDTHKIQYRYCRLLKYTDMYIQGLGVVLIFDDIAFKRYSLLVYLYIYDTECMCVFSCMYVRIFIGIG